MGVCADRHNEIVALVAEGLTGAEIAARIGATRSAVLGYCHRRGLALPLTPRKREMLRRNGRAAAGRPRAALPPDHPGRRPRPHGQRAFTDEQIVRALAAHMGGLSRPAAARLIGCSAQSIAKNWLKDEALCAAAREIVIRWQGRGLIVPGRRGAAL